MFRQQRPPLDLASCRRRRKPCCKLSAHGYKCVRRGRQDCIGHVGCTAPFARPYALHENGASAGLSEPYAILGGFLNRIRRRVLGNTKSLEVLRLDPARTEHVCKPCWGCTCTWHTCIADACKAERGAGRIMHIRAPLLAASSEADNRIWVLIPAIVCSFIVAYVRATNRDLGALRLAAPRPQP